MPHRRTVLPTDAAKLLIISFALPASKTRTTMVAAAVSRTSHVVEVKRRPTWGARGESGEIRRRSKRGISICFFLLIRLLNHCLSFSLPIPLFFPASLPLPIYLSLFVSSRLSSYLCSASLMLSLSLCCILYLLSRSLFRSAL